jgi:excisionase family DNA binding protein
MSMELLTVQETAQLLRVTPITVRRYIAQGRLPAVRVGRGVRVKKEAVEQLPAPIEPRSTTSKRGARRGRAFTMDDPLWNLMGAGRSEGPTDVSENKYKYLAEAYATKGE